MSRQRQAQVLWGIAFVWLAVQLISLRTGWLHLFFFDTDVGKVQGIDFFPLPRAFDGLLHDRSAFDTFHSSYGPYATWFIYHPAIAFLFAPFLLLSPWTGYGVWTACSAGLMVVSAWLVGKQGTDPLRRAWVGLLLLGSFPGFLMLYGGNVQALLVLAVVLVLVAVDRIRTQGPSVAAQRLLLAGLLLSLLTKPLVLVMLPLLLLMPETRRTVVRAIVVYVLVSAAFLVVPGLNPVALPWSQRVFLLTHPAVVSQTMNPYLNHLNITTPMLDNSVHWLGMLGLNGYRMLHVDVYSLPVLLDGLFHAQTPDALYKLPLIFVLELTVLVALVRSPEERLRAALLALMAMVVLVLISYGLIWEYHFTLLLPVAGLLMMQDRSGWAERGVVALTWYAWLPSLYVLLAHWDLNVIATEALLHSDRVLPALAVFCLLAYRATQVALSSAEGLRLPFVAHERQPVEA